MKNPITKEVLKKAKGSFLVKLLGVIITFLISMLLGRNLGPDGLGIINLSERIIELLLVFSLLGSRNFIIKNVSIFFQNSQFIEIWKIAFSSFVYCILFSIVLIFLMNIFLLNFQFDNSLLRNSLIVFSIALLPKTISQIFSALFLGYNEIWKSNLADKSLSSFILIVLLILIIYFQFDFTVNIISFLYVLSFTIACFLISLNWISISKIKFEFKREYFLGNKFIKSSFPFLLFSSISILSSNIDLIMLGWFSTTYNVGLYTVSSKLALLSSFFLMVSNSAISPKISFLYSQKKNSEIQIVTQNITLLLTWIGLGFFLFYLIFGKLVLSFWGKEFVESYHSLLTLMIGQLINISTGCVGLIMIFSGNEKIITKYSVLCLILNFLLNLLFLNFWGVLGVSIATSFSLILFNFLCYNFVKNNLKINTISNYILWR